MLVSQRTQAINALRGHAAEFGVVATKGTTQVGALLEKLAADSTIPATAKAMFEQMAQHIEALDQRVATLDGELERCIRPTP
jgi:transposase